MLMSELSSPHTRANHWSGHDTSGRSGGVAGEGDLRSRLLQISLVPAAVMAALGALAASMLLIDRSVGMSVTVLVVGVIGCAVVLISAFNRANAVARACRRQNDDTARYVQQW